MATRTHIFQPVKCLMCDIKECQSFVHLGLSSWLAVKAGSYEGCEREGTEREEGSPTFVTSDAVGLSVCEFLPLPLLLIFSVTVTHKYTHTHTHPRTHAHTHTHTHKRAHT